MTHSLPTLVLVPLIALLAPLLSDRLARWVPIPLVVFEIVGGLVAGPAVLGWAKDDDAVERLAQFGLAMLFFMAGYEIDFARLRGAPLKRAGLGWAASLAAGLAAGVVLTGCSTSSGLFVGTALTTTALGTILPVLRDAGVLGTAFGDAVMAVGALGEFAPIVAITLFLDGRRPGEAMAVLVGFGLLTGVGIWLAVRGGDHPGVHRLADATMGTSGQFAVRMVVTVLTLMVAIATGLGVDMLLGAFAAGVMMRLLFAGGTPERTEKLTSKLEAIGVGFLIPVFFINSGLDYDLKALISNPATFALLPLFLLCSWSYEACRATSSRPEDPPPRSGAQCPSTARRPSRSSSRSRPAAWNAAR